MIRPLPLALLGLTLAAAATPAPTGEWLLGYPYPAAVYDGAYSSATADTMRLLLRPDGQYTLTDIDFSYVPGYFGSYIITCGTLTVTTESGRYQRSGDQMTFTPAQARKVSGLSPQSLNSGCKRYAGQTETVTIRPYRGTVALRGSQLSVSVGTVRRDYISRASAQAAASAEQAVQATATHPVPAPVVAPVPPAGAPIRSAPWSATGDWNAVLEIPGQRVVLVFALYDDGQQSLSGSGVAGTQRVAWVLGSRTGTFDIGLDTGNGDVTLKVQGQFSGDRFEGRFRAVDEDGLNLGSGTLTMERP